LKKLVGLKISLYASWYELILCRWLVFYPWLMTANVYLGVNVTRYISNHEKPFTLIPFLSHKKEAFRPLVSPLFGVQYGAGNVRW
jgi:hypothetical protein